MRPRRSRRAVIDQGSEHCARHVPGRPPACHLPTNGLWPPPTRRRPLPVIQILKGISMINIIVWLVVGGLIGWVASLIIKTDPQQGNFLNFILGIVGAA